MVVVRHTASLATAIATKNSAQLRVSFRQPAAVNSDAVATDLDAIQRWLFAKALPAFKPQWDARKGAEQLYAAYKKSGITLEEFEGIRYNRIAHIRKLLADQALDSELRVRSMETA